LPDEGYMIKFCYYNKSQLDNEKKAYNLRIKSFESKVQHLWELTEILYKDSKSVFRVNDYEDLAKKNRRSIKYTESYENSNSEGLKNWAHVRLVQIRERTAKIYASIKDAEREVLENRLTALEDEQMQIGCLTNANLIKSGIYMDLDITTIKQRKTTLKSLAGILNEFIKFILCE